MTYFGMPFGMWALFAPSFRKQLTAVFGYDTDTAKAIAKIAKPKYREIISELPEFEKGDRFKMNIVYPGSRKITYQYTSNFHPKEASVNNIHWLILFPEVAHMKRQQDIEIRVLL